MTPIFRTNYYALGKAHRLNVVGYENALLTALNTSTAAADRDRLLRQEVVEITRHVTDGIRDLIKQDRRIRHLVLDLGMIPLATWCEALDTLAEQSMPQLQEKIADMQRDLEQGRIEGFPGTMVLYGKPTFATLHDFYQLVFKLGGQG